MSLRYVLSAAAFGALMNVASTASAAVTITSPSTLTLVDLGVGNGGGFQNNTPRVGPNATITFTGATTGIYSGTSSAMGSLASYTSPFAGAANFNANQDYYAVQPGGSITITYNVARTSFAALIGTIDSYNTITFSTAGVGSQVFTGTDIGTALGFAANGSKTANVMFAGLNTFNTVTFTDTTASAFEFIQQASSVPEPASWAMMILGMGAIGYAMRRKVRQSNAKFDARIKAITYGTVA